MSPRGRNMLQASKLEGKREPNPLISYVAITDLDFGSAFPSLFGPAFPYYVPNPPF